MYKINQSDQNACFQKRLKKAHEDTSFKHRAQIFEMVGVKFGCIFISIKLLERNFV